MLNIIYDKFIKEANILFNEKDYLINLLDFIEREKNFQNLKNDLMEIFSSNEENEIEIEIFLRNNIEDIKVISKILKIIASYLTIPNSFLYNKSYMEILTNNSIFLNEKYNKLFLKYLLLYPFFISLEEIYESIDEPETFKKLIKKLKNNLKTYYSNELVDIYLENYIHRINKINNINEEIFSIFDESLRDYELKKIYQNFNMKKIYDEINKLEDAPDKEIFLANLDNILTISLENSIKYLFYKKNKYEFLNNNFEKILQIIVNNYRNTKYDNNNNELKEKKEEN